MRSSLEYAARSKEGIVAALRDARAARLAIPAPHEHARRLLFGFVVPMTLFRIALSDAQLRRSMSRRLFPPVLCLALAAVVGIISTTGGGDRDDPVTSAVWNDDDDHDQDHDQADTDTDTDKGTGLPAAASRAIAEASSAAARAHTAAHPPPPPRPTGRFAALRGVWEVMTSRIVKIIAGLGVIEWILIWIGREHHDLIAYETSVLTGVPGEPLTRPPKLRLDLGWVWMKSWRAVRFVLFVLLVSPFAWVVGHVPVIGATLSVVVEALWAAYWASVFAIANTFVAWDPRLGWRSPWFIRVLERPGRVPLLGIPVRLFARLLTFATRKVWPACMAFEEASWEAAGLAVARGIASVPFLYVVFRPMFAPAATHALVGRRISVGETSEDRPLASQ